MLFASSTFVSNLVITAFNSKISPSRACILFLSVVPSLIGSISVSYNSDDIDSGGLGELRGWAFSKEGQESSGRTGPGEEKGSGREGGPDGEKGPSKKEGPDGERGSGGEKSSGGEKGSGKEVEFATSSFLIDRGVEGEAIGNSTWQLYRIVPRNSLKLVR